MMTAASTTPSETAGSSITARLPTGLAKNLTYIPIEAIGRRRPGSRSSSSVASQKLGTLRPTSPTSRIAASAAVPRRSAERIPTGSAIPSAMTSASAASSALTGSRGRISGRTGRLVRSETPKSPWKRRPTQSAYCHGSALLIPNRRRSSSICAGVIATWVPRNSWRASPGMRWIRRNTRTETPQRTGRRASRRPAMNAVTRPAGPGLRRPARPRSSFDRGPLQGGERSGGDEAEPLDVGLQHLGLVRRVQEDRGRLLDEGALQLVVDRLALGDRDVHPAAVQQPVHLGVLEQE